MFAIISRKVLSHTAHQSLDLDSLIQSIGSSHTQVKFVRTEAEIDPYITRMTHAGHTCHRLDYKESYTAQTLVNTVKAA